jgi:hypothetical protein
LLDVTNAIGIVPNTKIRDVVIESIAAEITPPDVFLNSAVDIVTNDATFIVVRGIVIDMVSSRTESRNLDNLAAE